MFPVSTVLWRFVTVLGIAAAASILLAVPVGADHCAPVGLGSCDHDPSQPEPDPAQPTEAPAPAAGAPQGEEPPSGGPPPAILPPEAAELVRLLNEERLRHGLPTLDVRADLTDIAKRHSLAMAESDRLYHNDEYFSSATGERIGAGRRGENVAKHQSAANAHAALMKSPGHRANILDPQFTVVGVGAAGPDSGMRYFTQNFLRPAAPVVAASPKVRPAAAAPAVARPATAEVVTVVKTVLPPPPVLPFHLTSQPAGRPSPGPARGSPPISAAAILSVALVGAGVWRADQLIQAGGATR
jgi:uncharacterized protein YkwD